MIPSNRRVLYQAVFYFAAVYNLCFGAWAVLWPDAFFEMSGLEPARYPVIWQCLGMVVGVYGLLYAWAARHLAEGQAIIAVGLLGKTLGPLGWLGSVVLGSFPITTLPLIVLNDVIWWLPFGLYLLEGTGFGRRVRNSAPIICATLHAGAVAAMLFVLLPGTELETNLTERSRYIVENIALWRAGWGLWILSGISLLGFYAWWAEKIKMPAAAIGAVLVAAIGLVFDVLAEALYISRVPFDLESIGRTGSLLTGGFANGLYTMAGILLTLNTVRWTMGLRLSAWLIWSTGIGLSVSTFAGFEAGMLGSSAILFPVFIVWCVLMGRRLR